MEYSHRYHAYPTQEVAETVEYHIDVHRQVYNFTRYEYTHHSDAEPLVADFCNEPGSDTVETYVDAVKGAADGYISAINLAEVHSIVRAIDSEERAAAVVDVLEESGIRRVDTEATWQLAANFKFRYAPALGDAFALGTSEHVDGMLLVGADDDYDNVTDVSITRFRTDSA